MAADVCDGLLRIASSSVVLGLLTGLLASGCRTDAERPPVDAVQQAFREDALTAREAHGRRVFLERCATCHGPAGRGDGQNAFNLQPRPPDFSESLAGLSRGDRRRVIEGGTAALDRSPLCPPWGRSLRREEVEALLAYMEVMARLPQEQQDASRPGRRSWPRPG